jgi:hypothetical protein
MIQKYLFLDLFDGFDLVLQDKSLQSGLNTAVNDEYKNLWKIPNANR